MRGVVCERLGDPTSAGVLRVAEDLPEPVLRAGDVRIKVASASLNFPDALQCKVSG